MFNQTRLIRYEAYMINGQNYCTNKRSCFDSTTNRTFDCPLWLAYCGPLYSSARSSNPNSTLTSDAAAAVVNPSELRHSDLERLDDPVKQNYIHLCNYFQNDDSIQERMGIPGVSNVKPISGIENYTLKIQFKFKSIKLC